MTTESVELVSRAFSAFNRRDEVELLSLCHPDPGAWLCELRDGKVAYLRAFPDEEAALSVARGRE